MSVFLIVSGAGNGSVLGVPVTIVIFKHPEEGKAVKQCLCLLITHAQLPAHVHHHGILILLPDLHLQQQVEGVVAHFLIKFVLEDTGKAPVLRILSRNTLNLSKCPVGNLSYELQQLRIRICVISVCRNILFAYLWHGVISLSVQCTGRWCHLEQENSVS